MPSIADHQSREVTKLLIIGESGTGKTGALASLAQAGYNLRIIDLDNGLDILKNYLTNPQSQYYDGGASAKRVSFVTLTEQMKLNPMNNTLSPTKATVWPRMVKLLHHWKDGDLDLGPVTTWGPQDVLVIDTLSTVATSAMNHHLAMNGFIGKVRTSNEGRRDIGAAQTLIESLLQMLYDESVKCNVIVNSHITYVDDQNSTGGLPDEARPQTGYASAIGKALSPKIPRYFNSVLMTGTTGSGAATKHKIFTRTQGVVNCKTSNPIKAAKEYPLETGLADYFKAVRS